MNRSIEIKARIRDANHLELILKQIKSRTDIETENLLIQEDVFFNVPNGRLKLRKNQMILNRTFKNNEAILILEAKLYIPLKDTEAELIYYECPDNKGPKLSDFCIAKSSDPSNLLQVLGKSLGIKGCIKKTRHLLKLGQTRIHIDSVEGLLGNFIELEVVLNSNQTESEGKKIADELMIFFSIKEDDLIECAYLDLPKSLV